MGRWSPPSAGPKLVAGVLCLDFANTADWHASEHPTELLVEYADLVDWATRVDLLDAAAADTLMREAGRRPAAARAALKRAIHLREIIYRIALALIRRRPIDPADLAGFNRALGTALARLRVRPNAAGFTWSWETDPRSLDRMLGPILRSAAELLTSDARSRIKQCADDRGCGWLFLDMTKNRSRRWCQMEDCGNRAKARRHYRRSRERNSRRRTG